MTMNKTLVMIVFGVLTTLNVYAESSSVVSVKTILDTTNSWNGKKLPHNTRNSVSEVIVQPGATSSIHKHPVNGVGYVLEGELTMFVTENMKGDFSDLTKVSKIVVHAGETWSGAIDTWTYAQNNGEIPAKFIVTYIGDADTATTVPLELTS